MLRVEPHLNLILFGLLRFNRTERREDLLIALMSKLLLHLHQTVVILFQLLILREVHKLLLHFLRLHHTFGVNSCHEALAPHLEVYF